jgi:hypothetical protein
MTDTHFHDDINEVVKNRASGYMPLEKGGFRIHMTQLDMIGDGGIYTTVDDFFKWDQNFYANKLGNRTQALIDLVTTPARLNDGTPIDYAFGLRVYTYKGLKAVGHSGSFVGYKAYSIRFPEQRFSVVILSNLGSFEPDQIAMKVAGVYLAGQFTDVTDTAEAEEDLPTKINPAHKTLSQTALAEYAGTYYSDELDATAILRMKNGQLSMTLGRHESFLEAISADGFKATYMNDDAYELGKCALEFRRDDNGAIIGFSMQADEIRNLEFKKSL